MKGELLHFNGVNGATGDYGLAPMSGEALAKLITNEAPADNQKDLEERKRVDDARPEVIERLKRELAECEAELARDSDPARATSIRAAIDKLKRELARRQHLGVKEGVDAT